MVPTKSEIKCKYISFIKWVFVNARPDLYGESALRMITKQDTRDTMWSGRQW